MLLEKKIIEYESKLKKISKEKSTQEIFAKAQLNLNNSNQSNSENPTCTFQEASGSNLTLGEISKTKYDSRQSQK